MAVVTQSDYNTVRGTVEIPLYKINMFLDKLYPLLSNKYSVPLKYLGALLKIDISRKTVLSFFRP